MVQRTRDNKIYEDIYYGDTQDDAVCYGAVQVNVGNITGFFVQKHLTMKKRSWVVWATNDQKTKQTKEETQ